MFINRIAVRGVLVLIALSGISACATLEDAGSKYPRGIVRDDSFLAKEWRGDGGSLALQAEGKFYARNLGAEYFECEKSGSDLRSGSGTWEAREADGASSIFLRFESGCATTFWLGELQGVSVIWTNFEVDGKLAFLK
ncbi:hypothetical protein ACFUAG_33390 [Streptomyces sp. NPDC057193]|uniref:hypothetical protein n=1 Tax=Streptomyces sp. NPDC057193 TaxID=3346043 RepID=UPI0036432C28